MNNSNSSKCTWTNPWNDSGDRGAAQSDHDREYHPDHTHEWVDSPYDWEQKGQPHIARGARTDVTPRPVTVQRCAVCSLSEQYDKSGRCG